MKTRAPSDAAEVAALSLTHLRRIYHAIHAQSAAIESSLGITGPQLWALHVVVSVPEGLSLGEIAERLVLHKANAGRLVDRLLGKKLVKVERPEYDRRLVIVRATPRGRRLFARPTPQPAQLELLVQLAKLPRARLDSIEGVLAQLVALLGAEEVEAGTIVDAPKRTRGSSG